MTEHQDIAGWLRWQLDRHEWTAAELARRINVSPGRISEWINGKRVPSPKSCVAIADAFHADPDVVLALAGHRIAEEPLAADDARARIIALVKRVRMSPQQAEGLEAMLRAWLAAERREGAAGDDAREGD